jgi:K(+)-stimulated pyrophosphate-energized sodium pump
MSSETSCIASWTGNFSSLEYVTRPGGGGEANLKLPPLNEHVGNVSGTALLWIGLVICLFGLGFGLVTYSKLEKLPVHEAMHEAH